MSSISKALRLARGGAAPTEAQKEAGNYKKHHIKMHGLDIALENVKGSERSGKDANGKRWSVKMPAHYGYIKRTEGADGDHVDAYVGPDQESKRVFVVNQHDHETDKFDEHKVMIGFPNFGDARRAYVSGFSDGNGHRRIGSIEEMNIDKFKNWLDEGDTTKRLTRKIGGKVPKRFDPKNGQPTEHTIYVTNREEDVVKRALGVAGRMTKHGVKSYTDPSQAYGGDLSGTQTVNNWNGSGEKPTVVATVRNQSTGGHGTGSVPGYSSESTNSNSRNDNGMTPIGTGGWSVESGALKSSDSSSSGSSSHSSTSDTPASPTPNSSDSTSGSSTIYKTPQSDMTSGIGMPDVSGVRNAVADTAVSQALGVARGLTPTPTADAPTTAVLAAAAKDPTVDSSNVKSILGKYGSSPPRATDGEVPAASSDPNYVSVASVPPVPQGSNHTAGFMTPEQQAFDRMQVDNGSLLNQSLGGKMGLPDSIVTANEMAKTSYGELGKKYADPSNLAAVNQVMLNRMGLMENKGQYGGTAEDVLKGFDANGYDRARVSSVAGPQGNSAYQSATFDSPQLGLAAGSLRRQLEGTGPTLPDGVKNATNYYNPDAASPAWASAIDTKFGPHMFSNPDAGRSTSVVAENKPNLGATQVAPETQVAMNTPPDAQGGTPPGLYNPTTQHPFNWASLDNNNTQVAEAARPPRLVRPTITSAGGSDVPLSSSPLVGMDPNSQAYKDYSAKIGAQNAASPAVKNASFLKKMPIFKQIYQGDNLINKYDSPLYGGIGRQPTTQDNFGTGHSGSTQPSSASPVAPSQSFGDALTSARAAYAQNPSQDTQYFSWTNPTTGQLETYYIGNYKTGGSVRGNNAASNAMRLARR